MKGVNAPLSTFSARIAACHAMGLISDEEFKNCDLIRKIRNQFAHKIKMSFKNDRVRSFCSSLALGEKSDTRAQFTTAAVTLILKLNNRAQYVSQKPLNYQEWPSSGDTGRLLW
jgi:DNA-binding MltR family transcriptional regulator